MDNSGYVYALINPSLAGLIKIGNTKREPKIRAAEISSATGVPTPFIVAYEEYIPDAVGGEAYVHALLEKKGYRVSDNREFFDADLKDVILAIQEAKNHFSIIKPNEEESEKSNTPVTSLLTEIDSLLLELDAYQLWERATELEEGSEDLIQDQDEAIRLYKQSIKLGCKNGYSNLGAMYRKNYKEQKQATSTYQLSNIEAIKYLKSGIKAGNEFCYGELAKIYEEEGELDNAQTIWERYIADKLNFLLGHEIIRYLHLSWLLHKPIKDKDLIADHLKYLLTRPRDTIGAYCTARTEEDRRVFENLISALEDSDEVMLSNIFTSNWWLARNRIELNYADERVLRMIEAKGVEVASSIIGPNNQQNDGLKK